MSGSRRRQQPEPAEPPANPSAPAPTRRSTRGHLGSTGTTSEFTITRSTNQPPHTPLPARQNLSSIPEVASPVLRTPVTPVPSQGSSHHTTVPILPHTPARCAAARMAVQLDSNIAMATLGPAQIVSLNSDDSELEELEPDVSVGAQRGRRARGQGGGGHRSAPALHGRASRGCGRATGRAQPDNTDVDFEPGPHPLRGRPAVTGGPPTGYTVDENGFTWAE
ncbi:hypothetical protein B0H14DRAFT_2564014 [Mycena olivaceomarginata]|nr:hypothetical protein B0H14DRAFT_2564014 [Mycena olivaceomarginata]